MIFGMFLISAKTRVSGLCVGLKIMALALFEYDGQTDGRAEISALTILRYSCLHSLLWYATALQDKNAQALKIPEKSLKCRNGGE